MAELELIENQILKLHKAWEATSNDMDGFKDSDLIEKDISE